MSEEAYELEHLAMMYRCEYCLASPEVWCRTIRGAKATALHQPRLNGVLSAFGMGYLEGSGET